MGQCASFKDRHGNILGYTLMNDMSQGTASAGYERLMWRWDGLGGMNNDIWCRYYWAQFEYNPMLGGIFDGWCKSDPDAFFIEELYQFTNIIKHMPSSRRCWVQGTGSQNILYGY
eukprot:422868_1